MIVAEAGKHLKGMRMTAHKVYEACVEKIVRPLVQTEYETGEALSRREWTDETLGFFYNIGKVKGYRAFTNRRTCKAVDETGFERFRRQYGAPPKEFLVDLCWLDGDERQKRFPRMRFALEVEWDPWADPHPDCLPASVDEDIMKLLYLRSDFRMAILGCTKSGRTHLPWHKAEDVVESVAGYMNQQREGDSVLLMFLAESDWSDQYGVMGFEVRDGSHTELGFHSYTRMRPRSRKN